MAEYTEGVCADGAAILKDGQPMTISGILDTLNRPIVAEQQGGGWQPIETAPKDGSTIVVWAGSVGLAKYVDRYQSGYPKRDFVNMGLSAWKTQPTHWRPTAAP